MNPKNARHSSDGGQRAPIELSATERAQLGTTRLGRNQLPAAHTYPSAKLWPVIRKKLVARSTASNKLLDPAMCAYTPGETLGLLKQPSIANWHGTVIEEVDAKHDIIVFVPCAKTKPWTLPTARRSKLYSAYNNIAKDHGNLCFVTISEPLGVVPMEHWGEFPQYDNPGLFADNAQRSGMTRDVWVKEFGDCYTIPYDVEAYKQTIDVLGTVLGRFMDVNRQLTMVSFVDDTLRQNARNSTHGDMLDKAVAQTGINVQRFLKRKTARISPEPYLRETLQQVMGG